jgi:hypothetical protein
MAKRFIDSGLFDDEWFSELNCEAKIFWIYYITKCDHAGLLKYNKKLIEFQTGIKYLDKTIEQLGNRISRVNELLLWCPKYLLYQYPSFPNCNFNAALSAKELLAKNGLFDLESNTFINKINSSPTVNEELTNSYGIGNGIGNGNGIGIGNGNIEKREKLNFPFESEEFLTTWNILIKEKKWKRKSQSALQASLEQLSKKSESIAVQMMKNTIAGEWQGLFDIDSKHNGKSKNGFVS